MNRIGRYLRYLWTAKDIRRKLLITILLLAIYRFASHVPVPGANREVLKDFFSSQAGTSGLLGLLDLLSGGAVGNFSVLAMGVYPYITAQIILQLLVPIIPSWQKRMEEDPREGQKWMERWTYYLAIPMAALQAIGQINIFNQMLQSSQTGTMVVQDFHLTQNILPSWTIVISMTAGTMFAIWLGELISEFGIRNQGLSLIIFAGIVSRLPNSVAAILADQQTALVTLFLALLVTVATVFAIVFVQQGRRNVPVMYPGRRVGNRMTMPVKGTMPLMVNMAGMIPLIFAQSLLTFPAIIASYFTGANWSEGVRNAALKVSSWFGGQSDPYHIMYFLMVVAFTFFYTNVLFTQQNYGENLKRMGAQIPGVSKGAPTQRYLTKVLSRITFPGALFLGIVAILPWLLQKIIPLGGNSGLLLIQSAGLLIAVGVVRDLYFNIQADLKIHGYDDAELIR